MSEQDPFYARLRYYVEATYEVDDLEAEVTPEQLRVFFDRCEELHSPLDLEAGFLEYREELSDIFDDEDIVYLAQLYAGDFYSIFGAHVTLSASEPLTDSEKRVRLSVQTYGDSDLGPILKQETRKSFEAARYAGTLGLASFYSERNRIVDRKKLEMLAKILREFVKIPHQSELMSPSEKIASQIIVEPHIFTQARWLQAMLLLDMVALLKELGIDNTDDLNF